MLDKVPNPLAPKANEARNQARIMLTFIEKIVNIIH